MKEQEYDPWELIEDRKCPPLVIKPPSLCSDARWYLRFVALQEMELKVTDPKLRTYYAQIKDSVSEKITSNLVRVLPISLIRVMAGIC